MAALAAPWPIVCPMHPAARRGPRVLGWAPFTWGRFLTMGQHVAFRRPLRKPLCVVASFLFSAPGKRGCGEQLQHILIGQRCDSRAVRAGLFLYLSLHVPQVFDEIEPEGRNGEPGTAE